MAVETKPLFSPEVVRQHLHGFTLAESLAPITPRPAFWAFALEDEWNGRRRLRDLGKCMDVCEFSRNACSEIFRLYDDAIGVSAARWAVCRRQNGEEVHREPYLSVAPEQAANDLLTIAKNATMVLAFLFDKNPELCRLIASRSPCWPVMADLTEKDWQSKVAETVGNLHLGEDIKGYLLSARTADENVIRCWATAIYETLFQTRSQFKEAAKGKNEYRTTEGCPTWAKKTLDLPVFTQANSRQWAKLGEEMLLQQNPDFLDSPDLSGKKRSWKHRAEKRSRSGKVSNQAIQREAFEDFAKELKNIAPERNIYGGEW